MNWYIGQEIVCVKTHPKRAVVSGRIYTIKGLRINPCSCCNVLIDIGIRGDKPMKCFCGLVYEANGAWWFHESRFAPLDADISELTEILEQPIKQVVKL